MGLIWCCVSTWGLGCEAPGYPKPDLALLSSFLPEEPLYGTVHLRNVLCMYVILRSLRGLVLLFYLLFAATLGAVFGVTTCLSAQIREEPEGPLNYFIGGCATGAVLGARGKRG